MNKIKLALLVSGALFAGSNAFAAADTTAIEKGQVDFVGELTDETCSIVAGDQMQTVTLPKLSTNIIGKAGDKGGWTRFSIRVEKCSDSVQEVAAHFEGNGWGSVDQTTGFLLNKSAAGSQNVRIAIRNKDKATKDDDMIRIGGTGQYFATKDKKATLVYEGGYYAVGTTAPGPVTATTMYTLAYK